MLSVKSRKMKAHFSPEHKAAYEAHKNVCEEWRSQGRPKNIDHPARIAKLESQRYLQKIAREDNISKCTNVYEDLMSASQMNINDVFKKLNAMKSCSKTSEIPYIETIDGVCFASVLLVKNLDIMTAYFIFFFSGTSDAAAG